MEFDWQNKSDRENAAAVLMQVLNDFILIESSVKTSYDLDLDESQRGILITFLRKYQMIKLYSIQEEIQKYSKDHLAEVSEFIDPILDVILQYKGLRKMRGKIVAHAQRDSKGRPSIGGFNKHTKVPMRNYEWETISEMCHILLSILKLKFPLTAKELNAVHRSKDELVNHVIGEADLIGRLKALRRKFDLYRSEP